MFTRDSKVPLPFVGGHELVGEICALGEGVDEKAYPLGSRVAVRLVHECGECYFCRVGHPELCAHLNDVDMSQMDIPGTGGMSEYLNVGVSQVYLLNQDIGFWASQSRRTASRCTPPAPGTAPRRPRQARCCGPHRCGGNYV